MLQKERPGVTRGIAVVGRADTRVCPYKKVLGFL
jgi:hypothetical protein